MRLLNRLVTNLGVVLMVTIAAVAFSPARRIAMAQAGADNSKADEDCFRPDPTGLARGIDRACPPKGSSAGVARGDFNGDGFSDLATGSPNEDIGSVLDAGSVTVIFGSANGLTMTVTGSSPVPQLLHQNVAGANDVAEGNEFFGTALASGNFDGDAFSDLAVGVPGENTGGAVQIFRGSNIGLLPVNDVLIEESVIGVTPRLGDGFGRVLVWGNFNGDSVGDLAVATPSGVAVFFGVAGFGLDSEKPQVVNLRAIGLNTGTVFAAGDFDKDGSDDLVIGAPQDFGHGGARVFVINGSPNGLNTSRVTIFHGGDGLNLTEFGGNFFAATSFGAALAVGDFNGDAALDLAVGIPDRSIADSDGFTAPAREEVGSVQIFFNNNSSTAGQRGLTTTGTFFLQQGRGGVSEAPEAQDHFGAALAAGRFNDDQFTDLAIGIPRETIGSSSVHGGAVYVIYGSATGPSPTAGPGQRLFHQETPGIPGTSEALDDFGSTLTAWNFGRDFNLVPGPCQGCFHTARLADLVIGVPGEALNDANGTSRWFAGRIVVLYGFPSDGVSVENLQDINQNTPGMASEGGIEEGDRFGSALY